MSFIHEKNHPHAKTLFVACCKMSQTNNFKSLDFSPVCLCTTRTMMMTSIWNFWISTTRMWIRIKRRQSGTLKFEIKAMKAVRPHEVHSWNKTILASQTHFQNMDNQSWKPLGIINSKFPVAVPVSKGVIRCQFAESWNMLEGFVI